MVSFRWVPYPTTTTSLRDLVSTPSVMLMADWLLIGTSCVVKPMYENTNVSFRVGAVSA